MPTYSVTESNSQPTTQVIGSVAPGAGTFTVIGIARAGSSITGTGQSFQGTYGSLLLNPDGSFTYLLDNNDPDTNVLGTGMSALERFTYTYTLNGVTSTQSVVFQVNGFDEPGQNRINTDTQINVMQDGAIGSLDQVRSSAQYGVMLQGTWGQTINFTNNGALLVDSVPYSSNGVALWSFGPTPNVINNGFIDVVGHYNQANGAGTPFGTLINNGVIRVVADRVPNPNTGISSGQAGGVGGAHVVNNGTIDVESVAGSATAINTKLVDNAGFVYVAGNASLDRIVGIVTGASGALINNSGIIQAASTGGGQTIGVNIWPDGINVHSYGTVNNSGTIVADVAIQAVEGYSTGIHITNSGHIEGNLVIDKNMNILTNTSTGTWIGNLTLGYGPDMVFNQGAITGNIDLGAGVNLYDGRGGNVGAKVYASGSTSLLFGGNGADLQGGIGFDRIEGGGGADLLTGNGGANIFAYSAVSDSTVSAFDTITDFKTGVDKLDLSAIAPTSLSFTSSGGFTDVTAVTPGGTLFIHVSGTVISSDVITTAQTGNLTGTAGDDLLYAITQNAELRGQAGNDILYGGTGANLMDGGSGADIMYGGAGLSIIRSRLSSRMPFSRKGQARSG